MQTLHSEVTAALRKMILTFQLRPGERLVQDDIAKHLKVSRTPVREAIRQLEAEGLVTILPYKGATVSVVTAKEIEEIYQVRIALESHASRLAMREIEDADIDVLAGIVAKMRKTVDLDEPETSLRVNREFYVYFYGLTRQTRLFDLILTHLDLSRRFRQQYFYFDSLSRAMVETHEHLLKLIRERKDLEVSNLIAQELQKTADELLRLIRTTEFQVEKEAVT